MVFDLMTELDPNLTYRNILELYNIPWDPLTELIQNSVRSCQDRLVNDSSYDLGSITVKLDAQATSFEVSDDGIGFSDLRVLGANKSTRGEFGTSTSIEESGFGMGLTSVLARSDWFSIRSINTSNKQHGITFDQVRRSIIRKKRSIKPTSFPKVKSTKSNPKTTVKVQGDIGFRSLWKKIEFWENKGLILKDMLHGCLKSHSALGFTSGIWGRDVPNIRYKLVITNSSGVTNTISWKPIGRKDIKIPPGRNLFDYEDHRSTGDIPNRNDLVVWHKKGINVTRGHLGRIRIDRVLVSTITDAPNTGGDTAIEKLSTRYPGFMTEEYM